MPLSYTYDPKSWDQQILLSPQVAVVAAYVSANTYTAGTLVLNGSAIVGGIFQTANPGFLTITAAANESANTFTVTGVDLSGREYTVSTLGPNAGTVTLDVPFSTLFENAITMSANSTGNISVGYSSQTATPWLPLDKQRNVNSSGLFGFISESGVLTYTVEYTSDPFQGAGKGYPATPTHFVNDKTLENSSVTDSSGLNNPAAACRFVINTWTSGTLLCQLLQSGDMSAAPTSI